MVYIAAILAIFLFYKFVSRNHKILVFKLGGSLLVLGGIGIGLLFWNIERKSKQEITWMSAEFVELTASAQGKSNLSVKICNNREFPLLKYEIDVSGYKNGRSTKFKLIKKYGDDEGATRLESDLIINPKSCEILTWAASFKAFDRYEVRPISYLNEWKK